MPSNRLADARSQPAASCLAVIPARCARPHHAEVARSLGIGIIAVRHAEGEALPGDAELTARFGVSHAVLRESVKPLAAKGLLAVRARIGTRERGGAEARGGAARKGPHGRGSVR